MRRARCAAPGRTTLSSTRPLAQIAVPGSSPRRRVRSPPSNARRAPRIRSRPRAPRSAIYAHSTRFRRRRAMKLATASAWRGTTHSLPGKTQLHAPRARGGSTRPRPDPCRASTAPRTRTPIRPRRRRMRLVCLAPRIPCLRWEAAARVCALAISGITSRRSPTLILPGRVVLQKIKRVGLLLVRYNQIPRLRLLRKSMMVI